MSINYRILRTEEWDRLKSIADIKSIPSPDAASVAVAENEAGELVGALFLQLALHMEPLVLSSPQVSFKALYNTIHDAVASDKGLRIYCFSDKEIIDRMAEHVGMTALPAKIFTKEI